MSVKSAVRQERRQLESWQTLEHYLKPPSMLPGPGKFAIEPDLAACLTRLIIETEARMVMELGSGLSTVLMGLALQHTNDAEVVALEHDARFKEKTERLLREFKVDATARIELCKMCDVMVQNDIYRWYDTTVLSDVSPIDLLLVDGPPGFENAMARYPAIPVLLQHMRPGGIIVVDDYKRDGEKACVSQWLARYDVDLVDEPPHLHGTAVLRVKDVAA
jgi:predicted O-methyltransferase YrrM